MITKSMLLLMAALAALAAAGPAVADLVTIEAGDYSIALNVDLVKNDSQEIDAGSLTYPLVVRGSQWPGEVASAANYSRQTFSIGSASEDVTDVPHDLLTLESNVGIQLDTYPEPTEGGLNTTPFGLGGEVENLTVTFDKNVTVGWINPIQTPMYRAEWNYGDGNDLPDVYFVLFAVDEVTTCRMESIYGVSGDEKSAEEFEVFLKNVDVLLHVRSSGE
ncbi:MAG: hypothetical protein WCY97_04135 [Methanothrix sp.]|uniref:Uncharacterized protein n=1 Tax=Methanothrix harundinacea TaxID=301375 RepID=A0A101FUQ8_9EURY|nr:MAG: hypothetical protein APR56_07640 [Methanosaeta sp. SDB]KUK44766.1 MAG: Uncharacterized protein XD72_0871 [Methanothrix harundinacea]MDD3709477.1 hypothetical protein [Methanothrix sp.]MDI9399469.1 hypothetical protein [Euryarchaeota archaeon]MCP1392925.1 hypothetical protein [Methanothrix harundinacea]